MDDRGTDGRHTIENFDIMILADIKLKCKTIEITFVNIQLSGYSQFMWCICTNLQPLELILSALLAFLRIQFILPWFNYHKSLTLFKSDAQKANIFLYRIIFNILSIRTPQFLRIAAKLPSCLDWGIVRGIREADCSIVRFLVASYTNVNFVWSSVWSSDGLRSAQHKRAGDWLSAWHLETGKWPELRHHSKGGAVQKRSITFTSTPPHPCS